MPTPRVSPPLTDAEHPGPPYKWPYGTDEDLGYVPAVSDEGR
jgi:hypothetical protein